MSSYALLRFIASWTRVVVSVMSYPCILCVALSMDLFVLWVACLTVFPIICGVTELVCVSRKNNSFKMDG